VIYEVMMSVMILIKSTFKLLSRASLIFRAYLSAEMQMASKPK